MPYKMKLPVLIVGIILFLAVILSLAGCGSEADKKSEDLSSRKIKIVTTIGMITDIVEQVGGERVDVTGLMGPGVDPHLYKASAGDVDRMQSADVIIYNGLHLEGAMVELFEKMTRYKTTIAVTDGIPEDTLLAPPEFEGQHDPHVWFDVSLWIHAARHVAEQLAVLDTTHAATYQANADSLITKLEQLHQTVSDKVAEIPEDKRVIITAHDAFNYMGRAYGFEVRGLQGISTATEAGTRDVQDLAAFIVERKIPAIFVESSVPKRAIEALQAAVQDKGFQVEIGGELFSDAMGDSGTFEGTYIGMVTHNIETIARALSGEKK